LFRRRSGHIEAVTPDVSAPFQLWSFLFVRKATSPIPSAHLPHGTTVPGRLIAIVLLAWTIAPAWADEICHTQGGQYAETRTCVSSVLPPQGGNSYGPDQITGLGEAAWCEGVPGPGIGQTVTAHQTPVRKIGTIMFVNGYAKTAQTFRANGRVKRARIETSTGAVRIVTLKDTAEMEGIKLPPARV
jgi:hypothetical protein